MASPGSPVSRPPQRGGGIFIAFGLVAGAIGGMVAGEPSMGLLAGLGIGVSAAILLAVRDRR
jgi:phage-related minor tail protein